MLVLIKYRALVALIAAAPTIVFADESQNWTYIGEDELSGTKVFVDFDKTKYSPYPQVYSEVLTVYDRTIRGIEVPDGEGGTFFDRDYAHRSYIRRVVF